MAKKVSTKKTVVKKQTKIPSKARWIALGILVVLLLGIGMVNKSTPAPVVVKTVDTTFNFADQTLMIDDQKLAFMNGSYENPDKTYGTHTAMIMNRSVSPSGTRAAAILVDSPGGSGTFYYVVGSMLKDGKETYSTPVLLGDRVKVVSVSVDDPAAEDNGMVTVEYLDRPAGSAMATDPTEKMTTKYAFQDDGNLIVVLN